MNLPPRLALLIVSFAATAISLPAAKPPKDRAIPPAAPIDAGPREFAFPGAEGFGTYARGGRGGRTLRVTTLEDHGKPGSLRWTVEQSGPRLVVFDVAGFISLRKSLSIEQPYLTVDGSTAPGAGITLKDAGIRIFRTHDIIIRHLRVRPGDESQLGKGIWQGRPQPIKSGDAVTVQEAADVTVGKTLVFVAGNLGPLRPRPDADDWASVRTDIAPAVAGQLRAAQPPFRVEPLALLATDAVEGHVLINAGATLPRRDAIDERLVRQYHAGSGKIINSQDDVGGYGAGAGGR